MECKNSIMTYMRGENGLLLALTFGFRALTLDQSGGGGGSFFVVEGESVRSVYQSGETIGGHL